MARPTAAQSSASGRSEDPLRGLCLCLEFDGAAFEGWQRQATGRTVQSEVEAAVARVLGSAHSVLGCGRTDAGTHARGMIASLRTTHTMSADDLARALDAVLPRDVGVRWVRDVAPTFHARKDALWKWYRYRILVAPRTHPVEGNRAWHRTRVPPLDALAAGARMLEGRHDFASFANRGSPVPDTVRTLHALRWSARPLDRGDGVPLPASEGHLLCLDAVGDGFLYKMVRTLVGTLLTAAESARPADVVRDVLQARTRPAAGTAAPAHGLTLMAVALRGEPAPALPEGIVVETVRDRASAPHPLRATASDAGREGSIVCPPTDAGSRT